MGVLKEVITTYTEVYGKIKITETPLIRCEECKWGDAGIDEEGKPFWKCLGIHYGGTRPTDFCSYGEIQDQQTSVPTEKGEPNDRNT